MFLDTTAICSCGILRVTLRQAVYANPNPGIYHLPGHTAIGSDSIAGRRFPILPAAGREKGLG